MQWNNPANQEKQEIQSAEEFALSEQDKNENERATVDWNSLQYFCKEKQNQNIIVVAQTGMGKTEAESSLDRESQRIFCFANSHSN